jgi:geranylgeranylglycerol-phosphate geranylgeranyltransferase
MAGYLRLSRPLNCAMTAAGVAVAGVVAVNLGGAAARAWPLALAAASAALFTGAGNALNDYFDRETDRVNHADRPIPRGEISPDSAVRFASLLFALSLALGYMVNLWAVAVVAVNFVVMVAYELALKARGAGGNFLIAYLVGSLFVFGGVAVFGGDPGALQRAVVLGLCAGLATGGREIAKDIEDVAGDVDRVTLPKRIGVRSAGGVAAGSFGAGVVLSLAPIALHLFGLVYLGVVLVADIIFIYAGAYSARNPGRAQRAAKYGMAVALVAFLAGGLLA